MNASTGATPGGRRDASVAGRDEEIEIRSGLVVLAARLTIPARPVGLVLFAHGSGSGRHSPRNRHVAGVLNATGLATMLLDLLTPSEEQVRASTFDVARLAERLLAATEWAGEQESLTRLPLGYFGASTGAAAALLAAVEAGPRVTAVVSRGGRPDLVGRRLASVRAPTLLIVGGADTHVLDLNRQAQALLPGVGELVVIPGAGHLFEEAGALDEVARLATDWFVAHLPAHGRRPST